MKTVIRLAFLIALTVCTTDPSAARTSYTFTPVGSLYDLSAFKVRFAVPAEFIHKLPTGQKVRVRIESGPRELVDGEICLIAAAIDESTRTFAAKAKLATTNVFLRPGMFAAVLLSVPSDEGHPRAAASTLGPEIATSARAASRPALRQTIRP